MLKPKNYVQRLIDKNVQDYLEIFGSIVIEGPKWCGKTWTSLQFANSEINLSDRNILSQLEMNSNLIFNQEKFPLPLLIDEWQLWPPLWDSIRNKCDRLSTKGNYILTGSTSFNALNVNNQIFHSGAGRIAKIQMYPMSLFESGLSLSLVSIEDMLNKKDIYFECKPLTLEELAFYIIKGGWPSLLNINDENQVIKINKQYLDSILNEKNILKNYAKNKKVFSLIIKSLARNVSTYVNWSTIYNDIFSINQETKEINIEPKQLKLSKEYFYEYIDLLRNLFILMENEPFSTNYRSSKKISSATKKHLVDPSLACAAMNLNSKKILNDLNMFGFLFENLVIRDLRIFANSMGWKIYSFRDNSSGDEIDCVLTFDDDSYAIIEIKLGKNGQDEAIKSINRFRQAVKDKPKFACIILGISDYAIYNKVEDIYIVPLNSLKPF